MLNTWLAGSVGLATPFLFAAYGNGTDVMSGILAFLKTLSSLVFLLSLSVVIVYTFIYALKDDDVAEAAENSIFFGSIGIGVSVIIQCIVRLSGEVPTHPLQFGPLIAILFIFTILTIFASLLKTNSSEEETEAAEQATDNAPESSKAPLLQKNEATTDVDKAVASLSETARHLLSYHRQLNTEELFFLETTIPNDVLQLHQSYRAMPLDKQARYEIETLHRLHILQQQLDNLQSNIDTKLEQDMVYALRIIDWRYTTKNTD